MKSLRILIVEDNAVNRLVAMRLLAKRKHMVVNACNGLEALQVLARDRSGFDLILMDIQMPEMDGFEATAAIRREESATGAHIPILAMTAHAIKGDRERCLATGMDGYVSKPIIAAVFFAEIARVLDKLSFHDPNARAATEVVSVPDRRTPAHIDREALLERVEGDAALLAQMLEIFEVEGDRLVAVMEAAVGSGDASSLERAAHTLKGMVANFTADAAANAASHLEEMGRTGRLQGAEDLLHELAQEVTALRALLSELCTEAAR